jgi:hypothetical protein
VRLQDSAQKFIADWRHVCPAFMCVDSVPPVEGFPRSPWQRGKMFCPSPVACLQSYVDLAVSNPQRAQLDRTRSLIGPG